MHRLNNIETIGAGFYSKPVDQDSTHLDYLYNHIFHIIPNIIHFKQRYSLKCLERIEDNFERFYSSIYALNSSNVDVSVWVGKPDTVYHNIFISIQYRNEDGDLFSKYSGVFRPIDSANRREDALSSAYITLKAACRELSDMQHIVDLLKGNEIVDKNSIFMLTSTYGDLGFTAMPIDAKETNLELNYGKDFLAVHNSIVDSLKDRKSGLYLFHGDPGTGKSSYIKHLLTGIVNRKIAYIPVGLLNQLVSPDFLPLLMDNKDIVLVIEDAEQALLSRETSDNSTVTQTLLNLTDGIVGDALNVSVIATFNTGKERLDTALLRKGRLKKSYEFKPLSTENSIKLAESIGKSTKAITNPMTLAEIYNLEEDPGYTAPESRRVGFF